MIILRPSNQRGGADHGWLKTRHTFSFNTYHDPKHVHFRALRVINEDWVAPGTGFGTHPHNDMEIITYVLSGALEHKDSLGTGSIIRPGDGQRMSAGTGILHSEHNPSKTEPVHLLQIWIMPDKKGLTPSYEQKAFPAEEKQGRLRVIASPDGKDGAVTIHQDASLYVSLLKPGEQVEHTLASGRSAWLQVARGSVELNGEKLSQGDGAAVSNESKLTIKGTEDAEILLFDLA
jgi:quercetin 2,3-dioxygenase